MRSININGYEYHSKDLLFSPRSKSDYRDSSDLLTRRLYATLDDESKKEKSPFYDYIAFILLNDIFFVCACLFEDRDPTLQIDKHLGWTTMEANVKYRELPLVLYAKECCGIYSCVLAVLAVQRELPSKVRDFMQAAQQKIAKSRWYDDFIRTQATILKALDGDDGTPQLYDTDLRPSVSLRSLRWIATNYPSALEPFLTPDGIRMTLSRIRDAEKRTAAAIDFFQRQQRLSTTADPSYNWEGFFAGLRTELQQTGKTEQESATNQEPPAPKPEQTAQLQQQLAKKDALIAKLQQEINELKNAPKSQTPTEDAAETASLKQKIEDLEKTIEDLKKQLKTAGEERVCQVVAEALEGTEDMDKEERKEKYNEIKGLLEVDSVPRKAKTAIKALLRASKKESGAPQTTINNFHGPVEQVANNIEEQHITKEKKQQ